MSGRIAGVCDAANDSREAEQRRRLIPATQFLLKFSGNSLSFKFCGDDDNSVYAARSTNVRVNSESVFRVYPGNHRTGARCLCRREGIFLRKLDKKTLAALGVDVSFVQDNHSLPAVAPSGASITRLRIPR